MFHTSLTTIFGVGKHFLIFCQLLLVVTEIDSKSNISNQLTTLNLEESTMKDNVVPRVVVMNNNIDTKGSLKKTQRKKRNFVNVIKKCYKLALNTTTSTCTPFFIRRTKMTHRNTTKWKKPMRFNSIQADFSVENGSILHQKDKNKIKKPLISHHFSTTLNPQNPLSKEYMTEQGGNSAASTDRFGATSDKNSNFHVFLSPKHNLTTIKNKIDLPNSEATDNYFTVQTFTSAFPPAHDFITHEAHIKESNTSSIQLNKTTNPYDTSATETNITHKKFHLKKIFHFATPAGSLESFGLNKTSQTFESKTDLTAQKATVGDLKNSETTNNYITGQPLASNNTTTLFVQKNVTQFKKIFHIYRKLKIFSSNVSTEKYGELNSTESILKQTTDDLETQIPSSSSQGTMAIKENQGGDYNPLKASSTGASEKVRKYNHFRNMLLRERKTTSSNTGESYKLGGNSTDHSTNIFDTNYTSEPSFISIKTESRQESKSETHRQGNQEFITHALNFEQQKTEEKQKSHFLITESKNSKGVFVLDQNYKNTTIALRDKSNNTQEFSERPTAHNPFKIKYLMRFKSPVYSTQCSFNGSSSKYLTTAHVGEKEYVPDVGISTESVDTQYNLRSDLKVPNQFDYHLFNSDNSCNIMTTIDVQNRCSIIIDEDHSGSEQFEMDANECNTFQYEKSKRPLKLKDMIGLKQYKLHGKNMNHQTVNCGRRTPHKKDEYHQPSTKEFFKEKFNVNVCTDSNNHFRDWVFGKTKTTTKRKGSKNEEGNIFKWSIEPEFNNSIPVTISTTCNNCTTNSILEMTTIRGQKYDSTISSFFPDKKFKKFFLFKTSQIPLHNYNKTVPVPDSDMTELKTLTNNTSIQTNKTTYDKDPQTYHNNIYSETDLFRSNITPIPFEHTIVNNSKKIWHETNTVTLIGGLNSTDVLESNNSTKVEGHEKLKHFFNKFHTTKMYSLSNTHNLQNYQKQNRKNQNVTVPVTLTPHYTNYTETKVEIRRNHYNKTILHNTTDVNDTSFNLLAYVMKPLDSLVSVFRPHSPSSVLEIGDINARDIINGSLPNDFQPPNSSDVFYGINNTNETSLDIHESKLDMALDLIGGLYRCVVNNYVDATPKDVHFYLYTRHNPRIPEELFIPTEPQDNDTATSSDFPEPVFETETTSEIPLDKREIEDNDDDYEFEEINPVKCEIQSKWFNIRSETKIIVHGYLEDYKTDLMLNMKEAYLSRGPYNVITVDWSVLVNYYSCYPVVATRALSQVGVLLARFLNHLVEAGVSPSDIHIVGFSLGAHVAGHAGTFLQHGLISRITGLDPALPYVTMEPDISLDSGDAVFVDIIHSSSGLLGQSGPMGHVDFYPNGGSQQPGCEMAAVYCSHRRAAQFFIESINSAKGFPATKCDSWQQFQSDNCSHSSTVLMGEPCPENSRGKYYLITGYKPPYNLLPEEHVKVKKSLLFDLFYDFEDL